MSEPQNSTAADNAEGPQVVASLLNEQEAVAMMSYLSESGITAHVWGSNLAPVYGEGFTRNSCQVVVRPNDRDRAISLLDDFQRTTETVDWDQIDVGEPDEERR